MKTFLAFLCVLFAVTFAKHFANKIDPQVYYQLFEKKSQADINVLLTEKADLTGFENIRDHDLRGEKVLAAVRKKKN